MENLNKDYLSINKEFYLIKNFKPRLGNSVEVELEKSNIKYKATITVNPVIDSIELVNDNDKSVIYKGTEFRHYFGE